MPIQIQVIGPSVRYPKQISNSFEEVTHFEEENRRINSEKITKSFRVPG